MSSGVGAQKASQSKPGAKSGDKPEGAREGRANVGLARLDARFEALVDATVLQVWLIDAADADTDVAELPAWLSVSGPGKPEILSEGWRDAVHPDDVARLREEWREAVQTAGRCQCEFRLRTPAGGYRLVRVCGVPIKEQGKVVEWVGTVEDLTALRRSKEAERRALESAQQAQRDLAFIAQANFALSASLDYQRTADTVARLPVGELCDWAVLHVIGEDSAVEAVSLFHHDDVRRLWLGEFSLRHAVHTDDVRGPGRALRSRATTLEMDLTGSTTGAGGFVQSVAHDAGAAALMSVPILTRDRAVGTLTLVRDRPRPFSAREITLAEELASSAALALDSAQLFLRERTAALTLQRSLLPGVLPVLRGAICTARYLPGGVGLEVGGDWYDVIPLNGDVIGCAVGDVMGRGVQAAGVMGQMRAAVRAYAVEGHSPEEVLARVDRLLRMTDDPPLVTCLHAQLDVKSGQLRVSGAGHLPPLVVSPDGTAAFVELEPGLPLGVGDTAFSSGTVTLVPGSMIVMYTDGLVETPHASLTLSLEQLRSRAESLAGERDLEAFADHLMAAVDRGGDHRDDVAVLVVRLTDAEADIERSTRGRARGMTLPPDPGSVAMARAFTEDILRELNQNVDIEDAKLLTSELVTNALLHAGTVVHLHIEQRDSAVRIAVADEGPPDWQLSPPQDSSGSEVGIGGRGLAIVAVLAHRWGVEPLPRGKRVWFELPLGAS